MTPDEIREAARELVDRTMREQGITACDPVVIARVAAIVVADGPTPEERAEQSAVVEVRLLNEERARVSG